MKIKQVIWGLAVLLLAVACKEDIDLKLENTTPKFVVDGRITSDTTAHIVRLTMSADYYSNQQVPAVSGAKVTIDDGHQVVRLAESDGKPGFYLTPSDYFGLPGRTYKLKIEDVDANKDGQTVIYEAQSTMQAVNDIDSIDYEYDDVDREWKVLLYTQDIKDVEEYYMWAVAKNDSLVSDQYSELWTAGDKFFDGNYVSGEEVQSIKEEDEDGDVKITIKEGDWIRLFMCGVTKEFHEYLKAVQEETGYKNPMFSGPPANITGNISNGGLGYFTAYSVVTDSIQVHEKN
ncbi:MAG: DUF4249 domain-containing protein [Marinilabiliaceae bacterium]|nr:DUF4249 domain-containing protein [Marinilabiliaceae bacterium]